MFAGSIFDRLAKRHWWLAIAITTPALVAFFPFPRVHDTMHVREPFYQWREPDQMKVGAWMAAHVPNGSDPKIPYNTYAYFDPERFPHQTQLAGPFASRTWRAFDRTLLPERSAVSLDKRQDEGPKARSAGPLST